MLFWVTWLTQLELMTGVSLIRCVDFVSQLFEFVGQQFELNSFVKLFLLVFKFVVANLQKMNFQFSTPPPSLPGRASRHGPLAGGQDWARGRRDP